MHHNLYAHNDTRNPKHRVHETLDWVDNVIYNWNDRAFYMEGTDSDPAISLDVEHRRQLFHCRPESGQYQAD